MSDGVSDYATSVVVVVTGLPRSGTSMMMRMLEAGGMQVLVDGIRKADVDNPNGYYEYEPVKSLKHDSSWVQSAHGKAVKIIYLFMYYLPSSLSYNVIFMRRSMAEIVASQDEMLRRQGTRISADDSCHFIRRFEQELRSIDKWLAGQRNLRVLSVDYNRTIIEPKETCRQITRFLSVDLNVGQMQSVVADSLYRQRQTGVSTK